MKILFVNDLGAPIGGAENGLLMMRDVLRQQGHTVRFFSGSASVAGYHTLADDTCFSTLTPGLAAAIKVYNPFAVHRLKQVLADFQPDLIHLRMFLDQLSPFILPVMADYPVVLDVCDYRPVCPLGTKMLPSGEICREAYGGVCLTHCLSLPRWLPIMAQMKIAFEHMKPYIDAIVACSEVIKRSLEDNGFVVDHVIGRGNLIDQTSTELTPRTEHPTLVYAGRFVHEKGLDLLLNAMPYVIERFPTVTLKLIGYGPELPALQKIVIEKNLQTAVTITGFVPHMEQDRLLEGTWLQILPARWAEPYGLVMNEAMLRGTVFVAPTHGTPADIIQDGETGFIFSPYTAQALGEKIVTLLEHPQQLDKVRRKAHQFALDNLLINHELDQLLHIYRELHDGTPGEQS